MNYEIQEALGQIAREKNVDRDLVLETLQAGLVSAVKKKYGPNVNVDANLDPKVGRISVALRKTVVETVTDSQVEISLADAQRVDPKASVGEEVVLPLPIEQFGRNAIQATKQVVIQRVREAERDRVYREYQDRLGALVRGTVQQIDRGNVIVKLDRSEGILPVREQISRDHYRQGDYIRAFVLSVERSTKGPQVTLSRTHPDFLVKLFESEVPEIVDGVVQIRAVAREPGTRSKIAVSSSDERIDPVGACVGIKGSRVQAVVRELSGERIDIVPWSPDPAVFSRRALAPAKVLETQVMEAEHKLIVHVADDQLSLAIGKAGQNARLAAKLTGWTIELMAKSDRDRQIEADRERRIDIETIPGIGPKLARRLAKAGIETVEDIERVGEAGLLAVPGVGEKIAPRILIVARAARAVQTSGNAPGSGDEGEEVIEISDADRPDDAPTAAQGPMDAATGLGTSDLMDAAVDPSTGLAGAESDLGPLDESLGLGSAENVSDVEDVRESALSPEENTPAPQDVEAGAGDVLDAPVPQSELGQEDVAS
jgi:N utilization substance protein A